MLSISQVGAQDVPSRCYTNPFMCMLNRESSLSQSMYISCHVYVNVCIMSGCLR